MLGSMTTVDGTSYGRLGVTSTGEPLDYRASTLDSFSAGKTFVVSGQTRTYTEIFSSTSGTAIIRLPNTKFRELKPYLSKILLEIFSIISPREALQPYQDVMQVYESQFVDLESCEFSPEEMVFGMFLFSNRSTRNTPNFPSREDTKKIIAKHTEMYRAEVFDSVPKILAALDPTRARLRFENFRLTGTVNFLEDDYELFENTDVLELFKKIVIINTKESKSEIRPKDFVVLKDIDTFKTPKRLMTVKGNPLDLFKQLPIQNQEYRNFLNEITVGEFDSIYGQDMSEYPLNFSLELSEYLVASSKFSSSKENLVEANRIYNMFFALMVRDGISNNKMVETYEWFIEKAVNLPATLQVVGDFISSNENSSDLFTQFTNLKKLLTFSSVEWGNNTCADFIISKLYENTSAEKTIEAIENVSNEGAKFNAFQWAKLARSIDVYLAAPVTWWSSLIEGDTYE